MEIVHPGVLNLMATILTSAAAFAAVDQHYCSRLARCKRSRLPYNPLVCFGIAFPAMVLFAEWRYLKSATTLRALARRWSKTMIALLRGRRGHRHILSFEFGLLWRLHGRFGSVFGLGFRARRLSFFVEAFFIAIYVYGWDRLPPRLHFPVRHIRFVIAGVTGSLSSSSVTAG